MDFEKEAREMLDTVFGDYRDKDIQLVASELRRAYAQGIEDAEKACEKVQRVLREPTREESRALADAGYMPVSEYVRLFGEK